VKSWAEEMATLTMRWIRQGEGEGSGMEQLSQQEAVGGQLAKVGIRDEFAL
jgi:hypothetical protein